MVRSLARPAHAVLLAAALAACGSSEPAVGSDLERDLAAVRATSVDLAPRNMHGLRLANPVLVASGTFGYGTEYQGLVDIQTKALREGLPAPLQPLAGQFTTAALTLVFGQNPEAPLSSPLCA